MGVVRKMKELKALFVIFLMIAVPFLALPFNAPRVGASAVTTFGSGASEVTIEFRSDSGGTDSSTEIVLPEEALVTTATMDIAGLPHTAGDKDYPANVSIDVGADGTVDWAWDSSKNGKLGLQDSFGDGTASVGYNFAGAGQVGNKTVRLPSDATVTNASFTVSGGNVQYFNEQKYVGHQWDFLGISAAAAGDLNNDSYDDFVAGGPHRGWGMWDYGHVSVVMGGKTPPAKATLDITAETDDEAFGWSVAGAGDVNGDGFDDIIVGAPSWDSPTDSWVGAAYIYYGGTPMDESSDVVMRGHGYYDEFGKSVAGIGDVNNDGYDDVLVGAAGNDTAGGTDRGAAYVFYGGVSMDSTPDYVYYGFLDYYLLGTFVANISDVNGDGHGDFMIGVPGENSGTAYIFMGGTSLHATPDVVINPSDASDFALMGSGVGDLNGDGYMDIGVQNDWDELFIYYGGSTMDAARDIKLISESLFDQFGYTSAGLGDMNGDGCGELLVGAYQYNDSYNEIGKAYLYYGGKPMDDTFDFSWSGKNLGDEFGGSVAGIGDFNGDGLPDFILGDDGNDTAAVNAGAVHLLMWANGIRDPWVGMGTGATKVWNLTNYLKGSVATGDNSAKVQAALDATGSSYTDKYGMAFTNLTVYVNVSSKGDLQVKNLAIEYNLTAPFTDLGSLLNGYMVGHQPGNDGKFHIPIKVAATSTGDVRLSGLVINYASRPFGKAPTGLRLAEGTSSSKFLDLTTVFTDPDDATANITYAVTGYTNSSYFFAIISQGHWLSVDAFNNSKNVNWTGTVQVNVTAKDDENHVSVPVGLKIDVYNVEDPPYFTSKPVLTAMEGGLYQYNVTVVDGDNDAISYSLATAPKNMAINTMTGVVTWTPAAVDAGDHAVSVVADDVWTKVYQYFTIKVGYKVSPGNHLPYITSVPPVNATVGVQYSYQVVALDDDLDPLTYTLESGPKNMAINRTRGAVAWQPGLDDVGIVVVRIKVSDGKDRIFQEWSISVSATGLNHLPLINGTPPARAFVGMEHYFVFTGYDQDGDKVDFGLDFGPKGMSVSSAGVLSWHPGTGDVGVQTYSIRAGDGKGFVHKNFTVDVSINHLPSVTSNPVLDVTVGKNYKYSMTVLDLDAGDVVTLELVQGPAGMKVDNTTRTVTWKPKGDQKGVQAVSIKMSDGKQVAYHNYTINVKGPTKSLWETAGLFIILAIVIAVVCTVIGVFAFMRFKKRKAEAKTVIEDVFLVYRDGRLLSHNTRRLKPEQDEHTMTAMLTAIQQFVTDSISTEGVAQKPIEQISFGKDKILLSHGNLVFIAAVIEGTESEGLRGRMSDSVRRIETEFAEILKEWDGDLRDLEGAKRVMTELLHGTGATIEVPPAAAAGPVPPQQGPAAP